MVSLILTNLRDASVIFYLIIFYLIILFNYFYLINASLDLCRKYSSRAGFVIIIFVIIIINLLDIVIDTAETMQSYDSFKLTCYFWSFWFMIILLLSCIFCVFFVHNSAQYCGIYYFSNVRFYGARVSFMDWIIRLYLIFFIQKAQTIRSS